MLVDFYLFAINPDFVVSMAARGKMHSNTVSSFLNLRMYMTSKGYRAGHHVPVHITACGQGREEGLIDRVDCRVQTTLENTM